jgi:hypothetical protein
MSQILFEVKVDEAEVIPEYGRFAVLGIGMDTEVPWLKNQ